MAVPKKKTRPQMAGRNIHVLYFFPGLLGCAEGVVVVVAPGEAGVVGAGVAVGVVGAAGAGVAVAYFANMLVNGPASAGASILPLRMVLNGTMRP